MEHNGYADFWRANKVYSGECGNGEFKKVCRDYLFLLIKICVLIFNSKNIFLLWNLIDPWYRKRY